MTERAQGLFSMLVFCQVILAGVGFLCSTEVFQYLYGAGALVSIQRYALYCVLVMLALIFEASLRSPMTRNVLLMSFYDKHSLCLRQIFCVLITLLVFLVATKDTVISRLFLGFYTFFLYLLLISSSHFLPGLIAAYVFRGARQERTLLVGPISKAERLRSWLSRKEPLGISIVGLLTDDANPLGWPELKRIGTVNDLERILSEQEITQVIIVEFPSYSNILGHYARVAEKFGVRLLIVNDLMYGLRHGLTFREDDGVRLIGLRDEPLENPFNRALKRELDIAISLPVIVFILPLATLVIFLCQWKQAPGKMIIRQARAGLQNRDFLIYKFRTMYESASGSQQATSDDKRIFPAGRWLRRLSIDELPQFVNVLRGEMSIVGPRPHLIEHNEQFARVMVNYQVRTFVKPGITGLAQVRGFRGETRTDDAIMNRVENDIHYIENWSVGLDLWIILRTAWQVFFPPRSAF